MLLRKRESELHARGILHAGIFGSVARGTDQADSDIDVVVEIQSGIGFGTLGLIRLEEELGRLFDRPVDVTDFGGLWTFTLVE